jgi:hypothetical protein
MAGLGVASFGHVNGVHMQNMDTWETYSAAIERGEIPLSRAYRPTDEERLIRELVLQLKVGSVRPKYFHDKYHVNILERFKAQFASLAEEGELTRQTTDRVAVPARLLRIDRCCAVFLPRHTGIRYVVDRQPSTTSHGERIPASTARAVLRDRCGRHRTSAGSPVHGGSGARCGANRAEHPRAGGEHGFPRVSTSFDFTAPCASSRNSTSTSA